MPDWPPSAIGSAVSRRRTVVFVQPGEMQPERDANQQGEDTSVVRTDGRAGRRGSKWFSFDVPVDETRPAALVVTYYRDSRRPRAFQVLVDGQRVGQESFGLSSDAQFFDVEYPLPAELVKRQAEGDRPLRGGRGTGDCRRLRRADGQGGRSAIEAVRGPTRYCVWTSRATCPAGESSAGFPAARRNSTGPHAGVSTVPTDLA